MRGLYEDGPLCCPGEGGHGIDRVRQAPDSLRDEGLAGLSGVGVETVVVG